MGMFVADEGSQNVKIHMTVGRATSLVVLPMAVVTAVAGVIATAGPAMGLVPNGSSGRILLAATIVCLSAAIGGAILAIVSAKFPQRVIEALLGAVSVRLLLTVAATLIVIGVGHSDHIFLLSVGSLYIIGLICETVAAILVMKQGYSCELATEGRSGSAPQ